MSSRIFILIPMLSVFIIWEIYAQDPAVSSANLGLTNMQAGRTRPPGWYYIQYLQTYNSNSRRDRSGRPIPGLSQTGSLAAIQQIAYISKKTIADGHLGFTVLFSAIKSDPGRGQEGTITVNPNPISDLVAGPFIQWYDKRLLGKPFSHRLGINIAFPTGAFDERFDVNPGGHRFRIFPHYEFTFTPLKIFAVSIKNNFYFSFNELGDYNRPAVVYNMNYAFEFKINRQLVVEAAGYYLNQFGQDKFKGDKHYYNDVLGISDTRERVFAAGPGMGYSFKKGLAVELKAMWEMVAKSRAQGFRGTMVLSYPL
ncbi:transporter [Pedobacter sp. ISL-68]|uniref:SphA family protein n=1 Tax=unclassified Pedobacter TaxID=2628915 RepID=UPI001BEA784C|nr:MULTISPECIES: transporter [unclassified Pedobacter]MBT2560259.1 transporter [Pedobacter sp. ISL-64]MBT2589239.1 transporter [Pedobacter sp. ISL-68]